MHTVDQNVTKGKEDKATRQARSAMQRSQTGLCISKRLDGPSTRFPHLDILLSAWQVLNF